MDTSMSLKSQLGGDGNDWNEVVVDQHCPWDAQKSLVVPKYILSFLPLELCPSFRTEERLQTHRQNHSLKAARGVLLPEPTPTPTKFLDPSYDPFDQV
eukprot:sb/3478885/